MYVCMYVFVCMSHHIIVQKLAHPLPEWVPCLAQLIVRCLVITAVVLKLWEI
jgi:hypothetical protein